MLGFQVGSFQTTFQQGEPGGGGDWWRTYLLAAARRKRRVVAEPALELRPVVEYVAPSILPRYTDLSSLVAVPRQHGQDFGEGFALLLALLAADENA